MSAKVVGRKTPSLLEQEVDSAMTLFPERQPQMRVKIVTPCPTKKPEPKWIIRCHVCKVYSQAPDKCRHCGRPRRGDEEKI